MAKLPPKRNWANTGGMAQKAKHEKKLSPVGCSNGDSNPRRKTMTHYPGHVAPDQAAVYTIEIQGQIDENWLSYFDGLEIEVVRQGRSAITTITGCLIDQAALQGILQHLYGLGLVLLRVERKAHYCSRGNYPQTKKGNERNGSEE